jgi:hypothetical protein
MAAGYLALSVKVFGPQIAVMTGELRLTASLKPPFTPDTFITDLSKVNFYTYDEALKK